MKKLNNKGFTLVELLAVIIILAVVVVLVIPNVLDTTDKAKQKSFDDAVNIIKGNIQDQISQKSLGDLATVVVDNAIATCQTECSELTGGNILILTGYSENIEKIEWTADSNGKVTITCATPKASGNFKQGIKYNTAC